MKALVYEGPKELNIREVKKPELTTGEVLIRVKATGICGSELSGYLGHNSLRKPPLIMGHEFSGIIEEMGPEVYGLKIGERVTVNPLVSCGKCSYCEKGNTQLCLNRGLLGAHLPGSFAEYIKVPSSNVVSLPEQISIEQGALVEPLACAIRVTELSGTLSTDSVLITGLGPIGLLILLTLRRIGVQKIYAVERNKSRMEIAKKFGAITMNPDEDNIYDKIRTLTEGEGVDVAIDAIGVNATRKQCIDLVKNGGRVIYTGLHVDETSLPVNDIIRKEISIKGSFAYTPQNFLEALKLVGEVSTDLNPWIRKIPLEEGKSGFEVLLSNPSDIVKFLLIP